MQSTLGDRNHLHAGYLCWLFIGWLKRGTCHVCIMAADVICLDCTRREQSNGSLGNPASPRAWQFGTVQPGCIGRWKARRQLGLSTCLEKGLAAGSTLKVRHARRRALPFLLTARNWKEGKKDWAHTKRDGVHAGFFIRR